MPQADLQNRGRIYRLDPLAPEVMPLPYFDVMDYGAEGEMVDDTFYGTFNASKKVTFDTDAIPLPTPSIGTTSPKALAWWHHNANTYDAVTGLRYYADGYPSNRTDVPYFESLSVYKEGQPIPLVKIAETLPAISNLPISMSWAAGLATGGQPVWSSQAGVCKPGPVPAATPEVIVPMSSYGLELLKDDASELLLTRWGWAADKAIYHYDRASGPSPTPSPAYTFTYGYPWRLERGGDGGYYVMLTENGPAATIPYKFTNTVPAVNRFRIVKLNWNSVTKVLTPERVVVDNFVNNSTLSWPSSAPTP